MRPDTVQDIGRFFGDLGGLHDAKVLKATWAPQSSELVISVDDLRANFSGLPGHEGPRPATLVFGEVSRISFSADSHMPSVVRIFDVECSADSNAVALLLSPSGRIEVEFRTLAVT
jgi:hypothetical protein